MYGILAFNKGEQSGSAEFCADRRKYGRGSACKGCRIARVKCSGKLDGTDCDRCKRLELQCQYNKVQTRGNRRNSLTAHSICDTTDTAPTRSVSPAPLNSESLSPTLLNSSESGPLIWSNSPTPDGTCWNESKSMADDYIDFDLDFNMFPSIADMQDVQSVIERFQLETSQETSYEAHSVSTPLHMKPPSSTSVQYENAPASHGTCETHAAHLSVSAERESNGEDRLHGVGVKEPPALQASPGALTNPVDPLSSCKCRQAIMLSLSMLRGWTLGGEHGTAEEFLSLFEKSIVQLQNIENCPQTCMLSQDLAILLLLAVEQLVKLLLNLATGFAAGVLQSHDVMMTSPDEGHGTLYSLTSRERMSDCIQFAPENQLDARIGSFEIKDPQDLQTIMLLLLQNRTQSLDAYVCRWSQRIKHFGLKNLERALKNIRKDLSEVTGLGKQQ